MSTDVKNNVIKRNGKEVIFDEAKIVNAIRKANQSVDKLHQMNDYQINGLRCGIDLLSEQCTGTLSGPVTRCEDRSSFPACKCTEVRD